MSLMFSFDAQTRTMAENGQMGVYFSRNFVKSMKKKLVPVVWAPIKAVITRRGPGVTDPEGRFTRNSYQSWPPASNRVLQYQLEGRGVAFAEMRWKQQPVQGGAEEEEEDGGIHQNQQDVEALHFLLAARS